MHWTNFFYMFFGRGIKNHAVYNRDLRTFIPRPENTHEKIAAAAAVAAYATPLKKPITITSVKRISPNLELRTTLKHTPLSEPETQPRIPQEMIQQIAQKMAAEIDADYKPPAPAPVEKSPENIDEKKRARWRR